MPPLKDDRIRVSSSIAVCEVQRLVRIADEVDEEAKCDSAATGFTR
jgi:hypothetical protein